MYVYVYIHIYMDTYILPQFCSGCVPLRGRVRCRRGGECHRGGKLNHICRGQVAFKYYLPSRVNPTPRDRISRRPQVGLYKILFCIEAFVHEPIQ